MSEDLVIVKVVFANEIRVPSMEMLINESSDLEGQYANIARSDRRSGTACQ